MKYTISKLTGDELNHAVALAMGLKKGVKFGFPVYTNEDGNSICNIHNYHPSHNWEQCGELIDRFNVSLTFEEDDLWSAWIMPDDRSNGDIVAYGATAQQAICRGVVASVYGDEVEL
jgi:hypothetical protein